MRKFTQKLNTLLGILAFAGIAVGAQAADLTDTVKPDIGVSLTYHGNTLLTGAGPFDTTVSGVPGLSPTAHFDAYCVDLSHYLQPTETVSPLSARYYLPNGSQIAYLYNTFASTVGTDKVKGAALQLSIWATEYNYNPLSSAPDKGLSGGAVTFNGTLDASLNAAVVSQATIDLTSMLQYGANYKGDATYFNAVHSGNLAQSLIGPGTLGNYSVAAVPEPGALSLVAAGLAGMGIFGLRRKRKA